MTHIYVVLGFYTTSSSSLATQALVAFTSRKSADSYVATRTADEIWTGYIVKEVELREGQDPIG